MFKTAAAIAALTLIAGAANAAVVTVYNTGLGAGGSALAAGDGQTDANYAITASDFAVSGQAKTYYNSAYFAENAGSRWVSYSGSPFLGAGYTTFATTFDLTGYNASSAVLSGLWGVDNEGQVFLNGNLLATLSGTVVQNFNQLYAFGANSGFLAGVNTLSFVVHDTGSPMAFRTDGMSVMADLAAGVPEPTTWALMIGGFGLAGVSLRRRRAIAA